MCQILLKVLLGKAKKIEMKSFPKWQLKVF